MLNSVNFIIIMPYILWWKLLLVLFFHFWPQSQQLVDRETRFKLTGKYYNPHTKHFTTISRKTSCNRSLYATIYSSFS
jgi:hypothetical protein